MNKNLIQRLLDQSCLDEQDQRDLEDWCNVEKFAELMVNEFDRVLLSYWIDSIGNRDKKTANYIDYIRIRTKIYFGVEE